MTLLTPQLVTAPAKEKPLTSSDLVTMLHRHYVPDNKPLAGLFAAEVGSPCGTRRADALWLATTASGDPGLVGHEIKVTRTDLLVELTDPTKCDPWAQYCARWWLVVSDPKIVAGLDHQIPITWGIMAPPSGRRTRTMTVIRPAPDLRPKEPAPGLRRLLGWQIDRYESEIDRAKRDAAYAKQENARLREQLNDRQVRATAGPDTENYRRFCKIEYAVKSRLSAEHIWSREVSDDDIIDALVDATATRNALRLMRQSAERFANNLAQKLSPLDSAREDLAKAIKIGLAEVPKEDAAL